DREVVVDRFRNADHGIAGVAHGGRHREGVIAADGHQPVDTTAAKEADDLLDAAFLLERIGARGAQDSAAERQDPAHGGGRQVLEVARAKDPGPAVLDAADLKSQLEGTASNAADGRVETGSVATAGE